MPLNNLYADASGEEQLYQTLVGINPKITKSQPQIDRRAFRPRIIFCPLFAWNAITGGKFIAPLLEQLSPKFSDSVIGMTLSIQYAIVACLAGWGGRLADMEEKQSTSWGWGRLKVMSWGVLIGTMAFLGHNLPQYINFDDILQTNSDSFDEGTDDFQWQFELSWHIAMRTLWAISFALTAPAMDGLSLAHLDSIEGATHMDFGKERMFGAVWWGLGSLVAGVGIDQYGFDFLYAFAIISALGTYFATGVYLWGLNRDTTGVFSDEAKAENGGNLDWMLGNGKSNEEKISSFGLFLMLCKTCYGFALVLFIFTFAIGMSVVDNLAFIFFTFLGSSNTMNGWTVVFTVILELPLFYLAPSLLERYGPGKLLAFAGIAYVVRVMGYTLVPTGDMWIVLLLEMLHGISYACSKTGSVEFVARIMPKGYEASGQGILFVIRFLGVVIGLAAGGWMQETSGPRTMYRVMAATVTFGMIILFFGEVCRGNNEQIVVEEKSEPSENDGLIRSESAFADQSTEKWVRNLKYDSLTKHKLYK